jgi:malyl-CoA/(S)-citramalyl-CoA lyase
MSFTLIQQATPRLHRSELAVPGSNLCVPRTSSALLS